MSNLIIYPFIASAHASKTQTSFPSVIVFSRQEKTFNNPLRSNKKHVTGKLMKSFFKLAQQRNTFIYFPQVLFFFFVLAFAITLKKKFM
jgi:hypothetical protein